MTRRLLVLTLSAWFGALSGQTVLAQDTIKLRSEPTKPVKGTIVEESPRGVKLRVKGQEVPESDIVDIIYDMSGSKESRLLKSEAYTPAVVSEDKLDTAPDRKKALSETKVAYKTLLAQLLDKQFEDKQYEPLRRNVQYKVAALTAQQALEDGTSLEPAIKLLQAFKDKYADGWQITRCLKLLGQLLVETQKFEEAEKVYTELPPNLPREARDSFQLLAAQVSMRPGKYAAAQAKLQTIIDNKKLRSSSPQKIKARIYQAECLAGMDKVGEARRALNDLLKEVKNDKALRGMIYNALGSCWYRETKYKDALWDFLRVDVVYYQDREEQARALYYLADIFDKLKEPDRARECRDKLLSKNFAGTDYQRRLLKDGAGKGKA